MRGSINDEPEDTLATFGRHPDGSYQSTATVHLMGLVHWRPQFRNDRPMRRIVGSAFGLTNAQEKNLPVLVHFDNLAVKPP